VVTPEILGFCSDEEKLLGPVQLQVVAPVAFPVSDKVFPAHTGLGLEDAETFDGAVFTTTADVFTGDADPHVLLAVRV
jgi:hypothetical protein